MNPPQDSSSSSAASSRSSSAASRSRSRGGDEEGVTTREQPDLIRNDPAVDSEGRGTESVSTAQVVGSETSETNNTSHPKKVDSEQQESASIAAPIAGNTSRSSSSLDGEGTPERGVDEATTTSAAVTAEAEAVHVSLATRQTPEPSISAGQEYQGDAAKGTDHNDHLSPSTASRSRSCRSSRSGSTSSTHSRSSKGGGNDDTPTNSLQDTKTEVGDEAGTKRSTEEAKGDADDVTGGAEKQNAVVDVEETRCATSSSEKGASRQKQRSTKQKTSEENTPARGALKSTQAERFGAATPRSLREDALTMQDIFLRSIGAGSAKTFDIAVRRWVNPYESPVAPHARLVLVDAQAMEVERKKQVEELKQKREREEEMKQKAETPRDKLKISQPSPRLCKPRHQGPKVGPYAPRASNNGVVSSARSGQKDLNQTSADDHSTSMMDPDSMPHFMRPLPPKRVPPPLSFRPRTRELHHPGGLGPNDADGGNDDGEGVDGARLTSEEFAQRFHGGQLDAHQAALNKAFMKITGAPMPPPPLVGAAAKAAAAAAAEDAAQGEEEDEVDDEKKAREEDFAREIAQKFHDDELTARRGRREKLLTKYGVLKEGETLPPPDIRRHSPTRSTNRSTRGAADDDDVAAGGADGNVTDALLHQGGERPRVSSSVMTDTDRKFAERMYEKPVQDARASMSKLWEDMERKTREESVHPVDLKMTQDMWKQRIDHLYKK